MKSKEIKSIHVLNGGEHDLIFTVGERYNNELKITRITQEDHFLFTLWLENGDVIDIISNNALVHWTGPSKA